MLNKLCFKVFLNSPLPQTISDLHTGNIIIANKSFYNITGFTKQQVINHRPDEFDSWKTYEEDILKPLRKNGYIRNKIVNVFTHDEKQIQGLFTAEIIEYNNKKVFLSYSVDLTEKNKIINKQEKMKEAIKISNKLSMLPNYYSEKDIIQVGLDGATEITDSQIGYFHFVDVNTKIITLTAWSKQTIDQCPYSKDETLNNHYSLDKGGIWTDCIFKKAPVIHNDYESIVNKKGLPENHVPIIREVGIPIVIYDQVVAVLGVGNKKNNYSELDVEMLSLVTESIWKMIMIRRAEIEVENQHERYRNLFNNMPNGYTYHKMIYDNDGQPCDFLIIEQNQASMNMIGDQRGKTYREFVGSDNIESAQQEYDWIATHGEVVRTGKSRKIEQYVSFLNTWYSILIYSPNKDHFITIFDDITEAKNNEQQYQDLVELLPSAMVVYESNTLELKFVNTAAIKMLGYDHYENLLGKKSIEFVHEDSKKIVAERMEYMKQTGNIAEPMLEKFIKKDGTTVDVDVVAKPIMYKNRESILVIFNDISEKIHLEEQLRQSAKLEAIGLLAGGVAHDFNNLLTVIRGYSELIEKKIQYSTDNTCKYVYNRVNKITNSAKRAEALTKQLLAFGRKQILSPEIFNPNKLLLNEIDMLKRLIREDIEISYYFDDELGNMFADKNEIQNVIMNLVINSRDAIETKGNILIETKNIYFDDCHIERKKRLIEKGSYVMIAITDDGRGMDKHTTQRIFEPFFTTKEMGKGVGLGLSTSYGIIKQSGGYIWVYSEPGKGTTFKLYFPRVYTDVQQNDNHVDISKIDYSGKETILIVEDEKEVREVIIEILHELGYKVFSASNGFDAIELIQHNKIIPDLILTDVVMPKLDGKEMISQLKNILPDIKVLYMSGYTDNTIVHRGILDPGTQFIQKPVIPSNLVKKIRSILDK